MKRYQLILPVLLFSCTPKENRKTMEEQLVGEWRNVAMKVVMKTCNNTDSTCTLEVTEANWEREMKIRAIQTFYYADGTYNSRHTNLDDSVVYDPSGKWWMEGDTLIMADTFPQAGLIYKYRVAITEKTIIPNEPETEHLHGEIETLAEFWGIEDFDQDGRKDDVYYGTQRKQ